MSSLLCKRHFVYCHFDREGQYVKAEPLYAAAVREAEGFGPEDQRLAEALNNYGAHLFNAGRYQDAEGSYAKAIAIWRAKGSFSLSASLNNLGALSRAIQAGAIALTLAERRTCGVRRIYLNPVLCSDRFNGCSFQSCLTSRLSPPTCRLGLHMRR